MTWKAPSVRPYHGPLRGARGLPPQHVVLSLQVRPHGQWLGHELALREETRGDQGAVGQRAGRVSHTLAGGPARYRSLRRSTLIEEPSCLELNGTLRHLRPAGYCSPCHPSNAL